MDGEVDDNALAGSKLGICSSLPGHTKQQQDTSSHCGPPPIH